MKLHTACKDCDGSCLGSTTCAPEGYAFVCRACQVEGCLLTKDEYENMSERCRKNMKDAEERLMEFERMVFGKMSEKPKNVMYNWFMKDEWYMKKCCDRLEFYMDTAFDNYWITDGKVNVIMFEGEDFETIFEIDECPCCGAKLVCYQRVGID